MKNQFFFHELKANESMALRRVEVSRRFICYKPIQFIFHMPHFIKSLPRVNLSPVSKTKVESAQGSSSDIGTLPSKRECDFQAICLNRCSNEGFRNIH
jgi:hypothetical protein